MAQIRSYPRGRIQRPMEHATSTPLYTLGYVNPLDPPHHLNINILGYDREYNIILTMEDVNALLEFFQTHNLTGNPAHV